ncbi:hypothetical protein [Eudoraea chungangensis]|uniref:hypothetical protein n=1 Tax=Eudoraea chungangensis TaxID=1481905 RepID=UPI0023EDA668|nr:hypothetical protein [Eudoraea chungangensis]
MIKEGIIMILLFSAFSLFGQNSHTNVEVGEVFTLGKGVSPEYRYINFPRANFILKRGAIANYKQLRGEKVVVHEINYHQENRVEVVLKREDGFRFFRFYPTVKANFHKAIESGELLQ